MTPGTVHPIDCLIGMGTIPNGTVDMVFADLPYGRTQNDWDKLVPIEPLWRELRRVCKPTAAMCFTAMQPFASLLVASNVREFAYERIWCKNKSTGFLNAKKQPMRQHENVLVFYREQPEYHPRMTDGHRARSGWMRKGHGDNYGGGAERTRYTPGTTRYPTTLLELPVVNNDSSKRIHPNQKPVELPLDFIVTYTQPGMLVLDPTMGSGTTAIAAELAGCRWTGFESDAAMAAKAQRFIEDERAALAAQATFGFKEGA